MKLIRIRIPEREAEYPQKDQIVRRSERKGARELHHDAQGVPARLVLAQVEHG